MVPSTSQRRQLMDDTKMPRARSQVLTGKVSECNLYFKKTLPEQQVSRMNTNFVGLFVCVNVAVQLKWIHKLVCNPQELFAPYNKYHKRKKKLWYGSIEVLSTIEQLFFVCLFVWGYCEWSGLTTELNLQQKLKNRICVCDKCNGRQMKNVHSSSRHL